VSAEANLLENAGFEAGDLRGWEVFGCNWRQSGFSGEELRDFRAGAWGAVNDVHPSDSDEWRGLSQVVDVRGGSKYTASAWIRAQDVENTESYIEILFLNEAGDVVEHVQSEHVAGDTPFTLVAIEKVKAPKGAEKARVQGVVHMIEKPAEGLDYHIFDDFDFDKASKMGKDR